MENSYNELKLITMFEEKWKDKTVMVIGKFHHHFGSIAKFKRYEKTAVGHGLVFENDVCEFFIFDPTEIKVIT